MTQESVHSSQLVETLNPKPYLRGQLAKMLMVMPIMLLVCALIAKPPQYSGHNFLIAFLQATAAHAIVILHVPP